jgi:hypothetical protein
VTNGPAEPRRVDAADLEYDLEYDLAHDTPTAAVPGQRWTGHSDHEGTLVATETTDTASDYGYDLAHDIPKA